MTTKNNSKPYSKSAATSENPFTGIVGTDLLDHAAERTLIGCLIDSPKLLADAQELLGSGDVLTHEGYRILYTLLVDLYQQGRPVKLATILQSLSASGQTARLQELGVSLMDLPSQAHLADFSDTCLHLRGLWVRRLAIDGAGQVISAIRERETTGRVVELLTSAAESVSAGLSIGADASLGDLISQSAKAIERAMNKPGDVVGVNTGLQKINRNLGGWQNSDIIMIAGRPGMGKSVSGIVHAIAAAEAGVPVAFLSLEMPATSLLNRVYAHQTGIPYSKIKRGDISPEQYGDIQRAIGHIERLPIHFYDEANKDVNDLSYKLLYWKKRYGIGLVIIDYVQKMTDRTVRSNSEYEVLTSVSNKLQTLQRRLGCPLIELAQLNRGVETRQGSKRPSMADLRSTGQFEQDATVIIMLYRDDYYKEKAARDLAEEKGIDYVDPEFDNQLEYGIVKSRDGQTGTAILYTDVSTSRITDNKELLGLSRPDAASGYRGGDGLGDFGAVKQNAGF